MNKNMRTTTKARHCYTEAYANYLRTGNLEEATRQVARAIYENRGTRPGTQQDDWHEAVKITQEWPETITTASESHLFDKALAKTRSWLKDVEEELGYTNPNEAYRALRAVLHAIRDRLPAQECAEFASQMPVLIAGMYYNGWSPAKKMQKARKEEEFLERVAAGLPPGADPARVTAGVMSVLQRHISPGELKDVRRNFPEKLRRIWENK